MTAYLFVVIPMVIYLLLFLYETFASFRRLGRSTKENSAYLHATWEVTHTILIIGVTNFIWLFSSIAREIGRAVYWGLIFTGFFFIVRAILYVYLFYIKEARKGKATAQVDYLFALSHLGVLAGLVYSIVKATEVLMKVDYSVNSQFIPWMWPGLIVMLAISTIPLFHLYRTKT